MFAYAVVLCCYSGCGRAYKNKWCTHNAVTSADLGGDFHDDVTVHLADTLADDNSLHLSDIYPRDVKSILRFALERTALRLFCRTIVLLCSKVAFV